MNDGHRIYRVDRRIFADDMGVCMRLREIGGTSMNTFYILGAVVATGLLVYLVIALLKAEDL
jgi:K+-transporting ATPase KdpF subunit